MKISDWLLLATQHLRDTGIDSARLDCLLLLEDELQLDRAYLLAHDDAEIAPQHLEVLAQQLERRDQHEPLAYIRGFAEFYGRRFEVTSDVLVPRPESEAMIELLVKHAARGARIADIGSGSGCLAVTAALELDAVVCAVDIDEACLALTGRNAVLHTALVQLVHGSLLEPFLVANARFAPQVLLANLPYVPTNYAIDEAARHEPTLALFAGADGLDLYRQLFTQVLQLTHQPELIITESLIDQHDATQSLAAAAGYSLIDQSNLVQAFKQS